jgi:hypothetical protein
MIPLFSRRISITPASAEIGCHLALGWPMPERILDLYAEFRNATNGLKVPAGSGLLGALVRYGLRGIGADAKDAGRALVIRGGPWTAGERARILDYCQSDVDALAALLPRMLPGILAGAPTPKMALGQALLRGRYMAAVARMERTGIPIDTPTLARMRDGWDRIKLRLIQEVDARYGVYEGVSFKQARFARYLVARRIPWPRAKTGRLRLDGDTFDDQARAWPELRLLYELRHALGEMRLDSGGWAVGLDGRNRALLSPFGATTGRNTPSSAKLIFGASTWCRGLIRPEPGRALVYRDFGSQEMGIAAALSDDPAMLDAYSSGDIYLAFAIQAGLAPAEATKASHGGVRDMCKAVVLGTLYGMGPETLARRIGVAPSAARALLELHRRTYPQFWAWTEAKVARFSLGGEIHTVFGWRRRSGPDWRPTQILNFPMQANGAEMLRLACCLATERGLSVCAPIHDAILIEAPLAEIEEHSALLGECMREASQVVLGGALELRSDAKTIRWPDRYGDPRGVAMWATVMRLLDEPAGRGEASAG